MKYGYAILLGENLPAEVITYGDCAYEQIVCPECRSPIFKTVRDEGGEPIHFLSHYRRDETLGEQCSLRVDSAPRDVIERENAESRDQTLSLFMADIGRMLDRTSDEHLVDADPAIRRGIRRMKAMSPMIDFLADCIRRYGVERMMLYGQESTNRLMSAHCGGFRPGFGHAIQLRIATDLLRTMLTPGGRSGMDALTRTAYALTALTHGTDEPNPEVGDEMRAMMAKAATTSRGKATMILASMERTPAHPDDLEARPGANRLERMFDRMIPVMAGLLYRLDYRGHLLAGTAGSA